MDRNLDPFWVPFGCLFGHLLGAFGTPLGALGLPLGSLWLALGPLDTFGSSGGALGFLI